MSSGPASTPAEQPLGAALLGRVTRFGRHLPEAALRALLRATLGDRLLALCLHRIGDSPWLRAATIAPCTIAAERLDRLIELLLASRPSAASWLSVTFDDGYDDAASYVASRAQRYARVEFIFFVCPEKTERGAGFRWDAVDEATRAGHRPSPGLVGTPSDVRLENEHEALRGLGRRHPYRLADVESVRALARLPNVTLGNHTNGHFRPCLLTDEQASVEYSRSAEDFGRLFGPAQHFAFPYGTPYFDVEPRHARIAAALGGPLLWSTEGRPYERAERRPGALLPRFPVDGTMDHRQIATQVAVRSALFRLRGKRPFPNELG